MGVISIDSDIVGELEIVEIVNIISIRDRKLECVVFFGDSAYIKSFNKLSNYSKMSLLKALISNNYFDCSSISKE